MGESLSVSIPIDGDPVRGEIFLEKSIQRGLQRGAEARDSFAVPLLPIAARRPSPRRVRDPQGDHPGDGIVSMVISNFFCHSSNLESNFELRSAPGGDMQTLIDGDLVPLEGDVVHFVRQLVEGLAYLHQRNIAHLDIKVSSTHKRSKRTCHASRISGSRNRAPLNDTLSPYFRSFLRAKIFLAFSKTKNLSKGIVTLEI